MLVSQGMEQAPLFSICIPAHNATGVIGECLASLARQSCENWEAIVVDDASTDSLDQWCAGQDVICAERLTYYRFDENGGPFRARRKAFSLARGRYVICLDSDDELIGSDALALMAEAIERESPDVLMFNMSACVDGGDSIIDYGALGLAEGAVDKGAFVEAFLSSYALNNLATKALRRELVGAGGDEQSRRLKMCEDRLEVSGALARAESFCLLDRDLYYYRPNEASTTHTRFELDYCDQQAYVERVVWERLGGAVGSRDGQYRLLLSAWAHDMEALAQDRGVAELAACLEQMAAEPLFVEAMGVVGADGQRVERATSLRMLAAGRVREAARWVRLLGCVKGMLRAVQVSE